MDVPVAQVPYSDGFIDAYLDGLNARSTISVAVIALPEGGLKIKPLGSGWGTLDSKVEINPSTSTTHPLVVIMCCTNRISASRSSFPSVCFIRSIVAVGPRGRKVADLRL